MILEFKEYLPDLPSLNNPGATVAKNVRPGGNSYLPLPTLVNYSDALTGTVRGAFAARNPTSGNVTNFSGDSTGLYKMSSGVWTNVSKSGGYSIGADQVWQFAQFGTKVLATTIDQRIQYYDLASSALFADLTSAGTQDAPLARYIDSVRDFLLVGNTVDGTYGTLPSSVRWAGIGSSVLWLVSAETQADYQDLDGKYGWVTQIIGGEYGVVFQERAITRFDYIGTPAIFQVNTVETNRGTSIPTSVIKLGNLIYFIGTDGFAVFDGHTSQQIGVNKVDKTFFADYDSAFPFKVSVAVDYSNNLICWAYPGVSHDSDGNPNKVIFYNYSPNAKNRWSYGEFPVGSTNPLVMIVNTFSEGYTLDQLDQWETDHSIAVSIDALPYSLDSRVWSGGNLLFTGFTTGNKLAQFTGTPLTAVLETEEMQAFPGQKANVMCARPVVDNSSTFTANAVTVQIGTRNSQGDTVIYGSAIGLNADGEFETRSNGRFHRFRVNIASGFTYAMGVDVIDVVKAGKR